MDPSSSFHEEAMWWNMTHQITGVTLNDTIALGKESFKSNIYIKNDTTATIIPRLIVDGNTIFGIYQGYNGSDMNYSAVFSANGSLPIQSKNYTWNISISDYYLTATTPNITFYRPIITSCGDGNLTALVFKTYDEDTWAYLNNSDYNIQVNLKTSDLTYLYSYLASLTQNISICVYPSFADYIADITLLYSKSGYPQRSWYDYNVRLDNSTKNVRVYLLNTTNAFLVDITTRDQYALPAKNVLIQVQKFNYTDNMFYNMTIAYTGEAAETFAYFERYVTAYKLILTDTANAVKNTYVDYFITQTPIELRTATTFSYHYNQFTGISAGCTYSNDTKVLSCTYDDPNSYLTSITLAVREAKMFGYSYICNETQTAHSGIFTCDLSGSSNSTSGFYYSLVGSIIGSPEATTIFADGAISKSSAVVFGASGVIYAMFIIILLFFVGIWKPVVAVVLGFIGFLVSYWIGLLNVGTAPLYMLGALAVMVMLIIMRGQRQ